MFLQKLTVARLFNKLLTDVQKQQFLVAKDASLPPPFLLAWFGSLWFLHVSRNKFTSTMASFSGFSWSSRTIADRPARRYQETVPAVVETLDLLLRTRESTTICNKGKSVFLYRLSLGSSGYAFLSQCLEPTPRDVLQGTRNPPRSATVTELLADALLL